MDADSTVDPRVTNGGPDGGSTLTPAEYARLTGIHIRTVRERIRRGELAAVRVRGRHGPEYRIPHPDSTVGRTVDPPVIDRDSHPAPTLDPPSQPDGLGELVALVREQQQTILELSGRCGYLMAELEQARQTIKLLSAPAERVSQGTDATSGETHPESAAGDGESVPRGTLNDQAPAETAPTTPEPENAPVRASQAPMRPWWKRWLGWVQQPA